jgi:hypothetical protein
MNTLFVVIPAKAGIHLKKIILRRTALLLDSRFRGNNSLKNCQMASTQPSPASGRGL